MNNTIINFLQNEMKWNKLNISSIEKIGGLSSENYKVSYNNNNYFVKICTHNYLHTDRKSELSIINKAIEINKDDGENYFALAICYKELKKYDCIEEYLIKANTLEPEDNRVIEEYAYELLRQGRNSEAIEYFKEIIDDSLDSEEIKNLIIDLEKNEENREIE